MKKISFFSLLLLFLAAVSSMAFAEKTTLLLYLCGSGMEEEACIDLVEMAEVEAGDTINMVVLAGGAPSWSLEDLTGGSRTLAVIRDGYFEELDNWGPASMGSKESLEEFLTFGLTEYPADRTIVILWDHGAGSEGGICFDEIYDDDCLSLVEIRDALFSVSQQVTGFHINILGCDACMMATFEMVSMLSHFNIDYYVASEETEPGTGWYYTGWLQALEQNPYISDEDLCGVIIDTFMEEGLADNPDDYLTLSAVRLSDVSSLESSMESFASVMTGQLKNGNLSSVRRGRSRMYSFGSFDKASWDMVDLGAALDTYAQFDSATAAEARRCLSRAVIANSQTDNLDTCCGLSVLIPQDTASDFSDYREGILLSDTIPNWMNFLDTYVSLLSGGSFQIASSGTQQISADTISPENYTPGTFSSLGSLVWDNEAGNYGIESPQAEISISEGSQGFTATLSSDDLANLDSVEGMLLMEISDDEFIGYVDFGTMQNNLVDWNSGTVVSLFDGTWPIFGGQPVPLYDQVTNPGNRRSLIPVKLNGEYTYLVVVFPSGAQEGRVIGANAGYDSNGLPIRNLTQLQEGDIIVPVYTMYYEEEGMEDLQEAEFDGDEILWKPGMTVSYASVSDEDDPVDLLFCFVFNDIYGDYSLSEMISFSI